MNNFFFFLETDQLRYTYGTKKKFVWLVLFAVNSMYKLLYGAARVT